MARRITKASKRRLTIFGTLSLIAIIYFVFSLFYNIYTIYDLSKEKDRLEKKYISNEIESLMELEELQTGREIEFDVFKIKIVKIEEKFIEVAVKRKE